MDLLDLDVEKLVAGGRGLARWDGMAVFISGAVPGDRLRVRITGRRRHHATAEIVAILQAGPHRITPQCPRFGLCGGCHLQQLPSAQQQGFKKEVIADCLTRIGHFAAETVIAPMEEISPAWQYRRKAGFKIRMVRGKPLLGFHQTGSHKIVDLDHCPVLRPELNALMLPLKSLVASLSIGDHIPQWDVMVGDTGVGMVMHALKSLTPHDHDRCLAFAKEHSLSRLDLQQGRKDRLVSLYQEGSLEYTLEGMTFKFLPIDFIQVNGEANRHLVSKAMALAGRGERAWDLFSGIGNFSLPLARRYEHLLAVEGNRSSLDRLRRNSQRAGLERVETWNGDLFSPDGLDHLQTYPAPDLILIDPPREGAVALCKRLGQFQPKRLVYVSCDPATFSRDAAIVRHLGGELREVIPFDLFPQTYHVEMLGLFAWDG
ncbi:MAG: 23S rRNA (uracil(1939)-C(5))-methyltransferase RlmD [Magnetococcales bacterium]|nr:23S rRNA (uracil(1939)-C(5))-methyltransferase RlmD [Magnetococcales bacterium]